MRRRFHILPICQRTIVDKGWPSIPVHGRRHRKLQRFLNSPLILSSLQSVEHRGVAFLFLGLCTALPIFYVLRCSKVEL